MITTIARSGLRLRATPSLTRSVSVWANVKAG